MTGASFFDWQAFGDRMSALNPNSHPPSSSSEACRRVTVLDSGPNADKVAYMSDGKILAVGSFDHIKREIPDFEKQAAIMGL